MLLTASDVNENFSFENETRPRRDLPRFSPETFNFGFETRPRPFETQTEMRSRDPNTIKISSQNRLKTETSRLHPCLQLPNWAFTSGPRNFEKSQGMWQSCSILPSLCNICSMGHLLQSPSPDVTTTRLCIIFCFKIHFLIIRQTQPHVPGPTAAGLD